CLVAEVGDPVSGLADEATEHLAGLVPEMAGTVARVVGQGVEPAAGFVHKAGVAVPVRLGGGFRADPAQIRALDDGDGIFLAHLVPADAASAVAVVAGVGAGGLAILPVGGADAFGPDREPRHAGSHER